VGRWAVRARRWARRSRAGTNDLTTWGLSRDDAEASFFPLYLEKGVFTEHRRLGLPHDGRGRVVEVLGEDVEDVAAQQLLTSAPGQPEEVLVGVGLGVLSL
jgi:hypothetical protein